MAANVGLDTYFDDTRKCPPLSREREQHYGRLARTGDRDARDALICANLRFVVKVARQYRFSGMDLSDLIAEGNIGLFEAADRFDPDRGVKFVSYAVFWIRRQIQQAIAEQAFLGRANQRDLLLMNRVRDYRDEYQAAHGERPSDAQVERHLRLSSRRHDRLRMIGQRTPSLDAPIGDGEDTMHEMFAAEGPVGDDHMLAAEARRLLTDALHTLSEREALVLRRRYGLETGYGESLEEIGRELRLTKERVRQIQKEALAKLRERDATIHLSDLMAG